MKELHDEPGCHFDMDKSGAALAWEFFFPGKEAPRLIKFVEDQDLWRWEVPFRCAPQFLALMPSHEFNIARELIPFEFNQWDRLLEESFVDELIEKVHEKNNLR